jgi:hypothetical protein
MGLGTDPVHYRAELFIKKLDGVQLQKRKKKNPLNSDSVVTL